MNTKLGKFLLSLLKVRYIRDTRNIEIIEKTNNEGYFYKIKERKYNKKVYIDFSERYYFPILAVHLLSYINKPEMEIKVSPPFKQKLGDILGKL